MGIPDLLSRGILLAPLLLIVHCLEESPSFVPWFNAHVPRGITQSLFWTVNLGALLITILVAAAVRLCNSMAAAASAVAWLSFLMLSNAIFHIVGAAVDRAYVPGLATAILLYLPYSVWVGIQIVRSRSLPVAVVALIALLGAVPMAVHGYRILFLGDRLF